MHSPRTRSAKLASAALAGVIALSTLLGPALAPYDMGGSVAQAAVNVDIGVFYNSLAPYGRWVDSPQYGQVWYPTGVQQGWRPYYNDGHWAYSDDDGWVWVSDVPWGWAPFHYGRWAFDPQYGWIWVPGRVWGPAWVTFRQGPDSIGWAPLPPDVGWDPGYGYHGDSGINISINFWSFVRPEGFLAPRFDRYAYSRHDYPTIINKTTNITNITVINNRIVNNSVQVNDIERVTHQRVERFRVAESDRPERTVVQGNKVVFYKPAVVEHGDKQVTNQAALVREDPAQDNKQRFIKNGQPAVNATFAPGNQATTTNSGQPNNLQTLQKLKKQNQVLPPVNGNGQNSQSVNPNNVQPSAGGQPVVQQDQKKKTFNNGQQPQFQQFTNQNGNSGQPQVNAKILKKQQQQPQFQQFSNQNGNSGQPQVNSKLLKKQQQQPQFQQFGNSGGQNGNGQPQVNSKLLKKQQQQQFQQFGNGGQNGNFGQPQVNAKVLKKQQQQQFQQQQPQPQEQVQSKYKKKQQQCGNNGLACQN